MKKLTKEEKKKNFGEVFTPPELVNEILDKLPQEVWLDSSKKWLEPSCGDGNFLVEIKNRLMKSLDTAIPNESEREKHILENMLYGVELQEDNWRKCRLRLGLSESGNDGNIVCADGLRYDYEFKKNINGGYVINYSDMTMVNDPSWITK